MAKGLKICRHCGGYFSPKRKTQVYCNDDCRNSYYDEHYFHKVETSKVCSNCGETFITTRPLAQTYCSPRCRSEAGEKRAYGEPLEYVEEAERSMEEFFRAHPQHQEGQFTQSDSEREKARERVRRFYVGATHLRADHKKPYPEDGLCELCHKSSPYRKRRLQYHHFDDNSPSAGLYLCRFCHCFAELVDQGELEHYYRLKEEELNRVKLLV